MWFSYVHAADGARRGEEGDGAGKGEAGKGKGDGHREKETGEGERGRWDYGASWFGSRRGCVPLKKVRIESFGEWALNLWRKPQKGTDLDRFGRVVGDRLRPIGD